MVNENIPTGTEPEYLRETYESVLSPSVELDSYLKQELTVSYFNTDGDHEMQTCYGDLKLTVDALIDYTHMLDTVCKQWNLKGFHRASYEYHADRLRKFAEKLQTAIGYDYAATLEKCRKKQKKQRNDDIGEDGITLLARHRKATTKETPREIESPDVSSEGNDPSVAEEGTASPVEDTPHSAGEEIPSPTENAADSKDDDFKLDIKKLEGGTPMEKNELRTALEGHLDTLKRNLAVVSLEELKTKYKKPFEELQHNISITATAYVKQVTLENLRIRADLLEEAQPLIQTAIDQSGLLKEISAAAFRKQDISEFDKLALDLKNQINLALEPFYNRHLRLYVEKTPPGTPPKAAEFYNEATGCIWRDGAWTPMKISNNFVLLPVQDIPRAAA